MNMMNEQIKVLAAGVAIALAGMLAGGIVVWTKMDLTRGATATSSPDNSVFQSTAPSTTQPALQELQETPEVAAAREALMDARAKFLDAIQTAMRNPENRVESSETPYQKVRDVPEVKAAHEAYMDARSKYNALAQMATRKSGN